MIYRWFSNLNPEPWTSPTASIGRKGKRMIPLLHKNAKLRSYQEAVREAYTAVAGQNREPVTDDCYVSFIFRRSTQHGQPCDLSNLNKALEDALQGYLFKNDRQIVQLHARMREQGKDVEPSIGVELDDGHALPVLSRGNEHIVINFPSWVRKHIDDGARAAFEYWGDEHGAATSSPVPEHEYTEEEIEGIF